MRNTTQRRQCDRNTRFHLQLRTSHVLNSFIQYAAPRVRLKFRYLPEAERNTFCTNLQVLANFSAANVIGVFVCVCPRIFSFQFDRSLHDAR